MARTYHTFDLIIIGAGTAGLAAFKEARKYTANLLLLHQPPVGTTCARVGCMPSKALIHAAKLYDSRHKMPEAGILGADSLKPDIPHILEVVRQKRDYFITHVQDQMQDMQEYIIEGTARFESPTTIRIAGKLLHTKATIIATGSTPSIPAKYQDAMPYILTSDTLFEQKTLPERIAVVGLGAIGIEMAQAFAKLGIEVTAISNNKKIDFVNDATINSTILETLADDMKIWLNADPDVQVTGNGVVLTHQQEKVQVDAIFIAAGRKPNLGTLGLKRLGIDMNGNGVPPFNSYTMQIPDYPLYIAGDATDERALLHEAHDEGKRAAFHALHGNKNYAPRYPQLQIIFTKPVIAVVGDTAYSMRHDQIIIGESDFAKQGRAHIENQSYGKIRLFANGQNGLLRGAEIMAPAAEHLAHFLAQALTQRLSITQMLRTPFYHPSLEEGLKTALLDAEKKLALVPSH